MRKKLPYIGMAILSVIITLQCKASLVEGLEVALYITLAFYTGKYWSLTEPTPPAES